MKNKKKKYERLVVRVDDIRTINSFNEENCMRKTQYYEYRIVAIIDRSCIPWKKSDWWYVILEREID